VRLASDLTYHVVNRLTDAYGNIDFNYDLVTRRLLSGQESSAFGYLEQLIVKHIVLFRDGQVEVLRIEPNGTEVIVGRYDLSSTECRSLDALALRLGEIIILDNPQLRTHFRL
jgi:hypothetical protein